MDTPTKKWENCLQYLRENLTEQTFNTWFSSLRFVSLNENELTLGAPNKFVVEYIEEHFEQLFREALERSFGPDTTLLYELSRPKEEPAAQTAAQKHLPAADYLDAQLSPLFTFENFVEGKANKLARAVALSIAKEPGLPRFNPFFLYGPSGVGKTHLVNAIGVRLKENNPRLRVLFVPAHVFKTQYTDSVLHNTTNEFIHFYQTIDVLIIDDIQEISTAKTQQAFFHIFNHLQLIGKQLILTCDKAPADFEGIEERMLTRFKSGMVAEMEKPDSALRRAILLAKIRRDGLVIPKNVVDFIVQNVESSVRELQGIVNSIMAYAVVDNTDITLELTERIVARAVNLEKRELSPENIIRAVAKDSGQNVKDLHSKSRKQEIVQARQLAMYLCHKYTGLPYTQIGRLIGKRDHSTVLHACTQVTNRISVDKEFRHHVEELEARLKN